MSLRWRPRLLFAPALFIAPITARAQCPDGSQPPCAAARAAAARAAHPPLDAKTWIVLPFANLARSADIDWLRDASVNLLSIDLSRWTDIRVVDERRVTDILRQSPSLRARQSLSLDDGLEVARRAGAGNMVMGDLIKVGNRTTLVATVFDARDGRRIRQVREETAATDSLLLVFGKLARAILDVAPPAGARLGAIGASRIDAYQEYLGGVQALNRFDLESARQRLEGALRLDSTFALAHYKLAVVATLENPLAPAVRRRSASAAVRFSGPLPPRERALIAGLAAMTDFDYGQACETYGALARNDSSDVEALFGLGDCLYRNPFSVPVAGDANRVRPSGSWNTALQVLRRVLLLDPSYHLAFQDILNVLSAEERNGCRSLNPAGFCVPPFVVFPARRDGDSLLFGPLPTRGFVAEYTAQAAEAARTSTRTRNLEQALAIAWEWVAAGPSETRARAALGHVLLLNGQLLQADVELAKAGNAFRPSERLGVLADRAEIAMKLGRGREAVAWLDSMKSPGTSSGAAIGFLRALNPATGRLAEITAAPQWRQTLPEGGGRGPFARYDPLLLRVLLGVAHDSAVMVERQAFDTLARFIEAHPRCRTPPVTCPLSPTGAIASSLMYGLRLPRTEWPPMTGTGDPFVAPARALARHDTAGLRAAARMLDSMSASFVASRTPDDGATVVAADAFLVLGDSLAALKRTRRMLDTTLAFTPLAIHPTSRVVRFPGPLIPRMMLLRAELAAALGFRQEARTWYSRFLDLWSKADAEFAPVVERARRALAMLGAV